MWHPGSVFDYGVKIAFLGRILANLTFIIQHNILVWEERHISPWKINFYQKIIQEENDFLERIFTPGGKYICQNCS